MNSKLRVKLFQADLIWQSPIRNMQKLHSMKDELQHVDLLICPEMYTTGFSMAVQNIAEKWPGESLESLKELSRETDTAIIASIVVEDGGKYFNRLVFVKPDSGVEVYDKRHLFTMGEEDKYYTAGSKRLIVNYKGWRIMPLVCYDLRFPVWSRNQDEYDLLVYVANWPDSRKDVWLSLLKARALENQAYVVGVNRVGKDGMGLSYTGDSRIFDAKGQELLKCVPGKETAEVCALSLNDLLSFRKKFPALNDRDKFTINF